MNQSLVEQIKACLPITAFVAQYTNGLKPSGQGWYTGRCPFHQDPTDPPNKRKFWVNAELGICGCFVPRCRAKQPNGKPMDVINFASRLWGCSNAEAISVPVLLVTGDRSPARYARMHSALQTCLPQSNHIVIADSGHMMIRSNPTEFTFETQYFITGE